MENDPAIDSARRVDPLARNGSTRLGESKKTSRVHVNAISVDIGILHEASQSLTRVEKVPG